MGGALLVAQFGKDYCCMIDTIHFCSKDIFFGKLRDIIRFNTIIGFKIIKELKQHY